MKQIVVYTTNNCGFCEAAKRLLQEKNLEFVEVNIADKDDKKLELVNKTGHRTLPQIFIDDKFIGGYAELKSHLAG